jgi:hypothetical protein
MGVYGRRELERAAKDSKHAVKVLDWKINKRRGCLQCDKSQL